MRGQCVAMKAIWVWVFLTAACFAQTTAVTATLTDSDSQTWNNGSYVITFVPAYGVPGPYTWNGGHDFTRQFRGSLNGSGVLSVSIPDSSYINPSGSKWEFTLCPYASFSCSQITIPVTGASVDLSATLSAALTAPRFGAGPNAYGYLDIEVGTPAAPLLPGAQYFNVVSLTERCWNTSIWQNCGGGGGGGGGLPNYAVSFTNQVQVTILGTAHNFGSPNLLLQCYDNASPPNAVYPSSWTVNQASYNVIVNFAIAQSGYCVLNGSGGAGSGTINGSGTAAHLPKFSGSTTITDSTLQDNGTTISSSEPASFAGLTDTTLAGGKDLWDNSGTIQEIAGSTVTAGSGTAPASRCTDIQGGVITACPDLNFNVAPASPSTLSSGSNTVTFTNCPSGVNGTDTVAALNPHYIMIVSAGGDTSPNEPVLITGGTCTSGAAGGTITFTAAFAHIAGYHIASATQGIQEAVQLSGINHANPEAKVQLPASTNFTINAPVFLSRSDMDFNCNWDRVFVASFEAGFVMGNRANFGVGPDSSTSNQAQEFHNCDFVQTIAKWSVQPTGSIAGGSPTATLTIPTCPSGFYAAIPNQVLWVAGAASGLPTTPYGIGEWVVTTGGTCTPGATNGTIAIAATGFLTNLSAHDNGYTISNCVSPAIEDALGVNGHIHDIRIISPGSGGGFGSGIWIDNDQSSGVDNIDLDAGSPGRIDSDFQSSGIFSPGPFAINAAIGHLGPNLNISGWGSCIRWYDGNDLWVGAGICQNYVMGGIISGLKRGGFPYTAISAGMHFENGGVTAPLGVPIGNPAVLIMGANVPADVTTEYLNSGGVFSTSNGAPWPIYLNRAGEASQYYYLVAHNNTITTGATCNSGGDCVSPPILMGKALVNDPSVNNVTVSFYGWGSGLATTPSTQPSSYDLLRVQGTGTAYPIPPIATASIAVATGISPASICNIHNLCQITDNVAPASLASYTPVYLQTSNKRYYPIAQLLPGNIAITGAATAGLSVAGKYRGYPACFNIMEFFGTTWAASTMTPALGTENAIETCPYGLAPVSQPGGSSICSKLSSGSPASAACVSASSGTVTIPAGQTSVKVSTTAVQLWTRFTTPVDDQNTLTGTVLGTTCNTTGGRTYWISAVNPGSDFTITTSAAPVTNPACIDWNLVNQ